MNRSNGQGSHRSKGGGSDFLHLSIGDAPAGGRADWLAGRIRDAIGDGRLPLGSRLPATRTLAADLHVSRGVVTEAYRRLAEEGHVAGRGRNGTVVVAAPVGTRAPAPAAPPGVATPPFGAPPGPDAFDLLRAAPARIDLSPGTPDLTAFPRAAWLRAERAVLRDLPAVGLGYADARGAPALRTAVAGWLARNRGIVADPAGILVVAGTAQALTLLGRVLRADGTDAVAVEDPGSLGTRQHVAGTGLRTPPVPVDAAGLRVDALRATGARAVLLTPAHQFPTGVVLSGERRRDLLGWARDGGLVIEDDYDSEHRYDRPPVPALRALLAEHVCYAGSVSKLLAPALRIGWLLPPPRHFDALFAAKRYADLGNSALPQLVLARLMESGELDAHLRLLRTRHRRRRDTMIAAIRTYLPGATVHGAAAGLHLTVTFEGPGTPDADPARLADRELAAAALARGVKVQPLSWHAQRPLPPGLVLGYAAATGTQIHEGVAAIADAVRELWGAAVTAGADSRA
ncbi:MocR-like pyridoxine biosynthesis transcription factor PdxR [Actinacidiphila acididurans]|uniref:PLP-dependent aminotransferase family protein n=1 Tax=Actinacidiphila acididurans TaxID=2784346 RepID=A0ABS2TLB3_9ACTN|nr:PLP-dependent aminotransferase family protein [Actinacidiphila acididurans]MBM9504122.1 PLP-dependent aminotransferase family protein [Actinacidiphila acididurans]